MQQMRNPVHLDLDGNRYLLFNFFRRASGPLRNHLNPGIGDVGISLDRQAVERDHAPNEKQKPDAQHHEAILEGKGDERVDHYCSTEFWNSSAFVTTLWPGDIPDLISCAPP